MTLQLTFDLLSSAETDAKIKAAAMKAVELDDGLSEGHAELGNYYVEKSVGLQCRRAGV